MFRVASTRDPCTIVFILMGLTDLHVDLHTVGFNDYNSLDCSASLESCNQLPK